MNNIGVLNFVCFFFYLYYFGKNKVNYNKFKIIFNIFSCIYVYYGFFLLYLVKIFIDIDCFYILFEKIMLL